MADIFKINPETIQHEVGVNATPQAPPADYGYGPSSQAHQLFNRLSKHEKAERALLKHFMKDKDTF